LSEPGCNQAAIKKIISRREKHDIHQIAPRRNPCIDHRPRNVPVHLWLRRHLPPQSQEQSQPQVAETPTAPITSASVATVADSSVIKAPAAPADEAYRRTNFTAIRQTAPFSPSPQVATVLTMPITFRLN